MNALDRFTENVTEIINSGFDAIVINDIHYDLQNLIESTTVYERNK